MQVERKQSRRRGGFTLLEVMLVLIIIVVIGSLAYTALGPMQKSAYRKTAKSQVQGFENGLKAYSLDAGDYPSTAQGLDALRSRPSDLAEGVEWNGPYMEKLPVDPWRNSYQYEYPGKHNSERPDIWSSGPDGVSGTDDDIGNWQD